MSPLLVCTYVTRVETLKKHILIVNQHGENRGDEAAMRAMLSGFTEHLGDVEFTLLYQFRDRQLKLTFEENVEDLPIVLPIADYLKALVFTLFKFFRIELMFLLPSTLTPIINAYKRTDLVVSAPGGPYFGDIYADHEILHWWFIYLGYLYKKPIFLYATSAGPFKNKFLNPIRRWLYPKFTQLVTREERSSSYIKGLIGKTTQIEVTADSAIQQSFRPYSRKAYFKDSVQDHESRLLAAISLNDYKYPNSSQPDTCKQRYNDAIIKVLTYLVSDKKAHLLLFPQLYGSVHDDVAFLNEICASLPTSASWEIVEPDLNSDMQRRLFGMCDVHLASRYHPAIFGNTALVPGVCIYYEHKALGFMKQLDLERYAFDIYDIQSNNIINALENIFENKPALIEHLAKRVPELRERARQTTRLAVQIISMADK